MATRYVGLACFGISLILLLDTNILIDVLRGEAAALEWLRQNGEGAAISVISWIEVLVGCEPPELDTVRRWLEGFARLELDRAVAEEAVLCRQRFGLKVPDAVILATARCHGRTLVTRNSRDFPASMEGVLLPYALRR
jgi:predicted nucleic acid-binding protein